MKAIPFSQVLQVVKPEYCYVQLTPNNSVRNNNTYKLAKTINSLYKNMAHSIKKDQAKVINALGREFLFGTHYTVTTSPKVSYYVYIEKKRIEFYLIVPKQHYSVLKEKISDTWSNITVSIIESVPTFSDKATIYQLCYAKEDGLSLAVDRRNNELLESNLNVVDVLEEGDKVGIFYNFIPSSQFSWRSKYGKTIAKIRSEIPVDRDKTNVWYLLKMVLNAIIDTLNQAGALAAGTNKQLVVGREAMAFQQALEQFASTRKVSDATIQKGTDVVLDTQILTLSESQDRLRQHNNAKSLAQSFDTVTQDNSLSYRPYRKPFKPLTLRISGADVNKVSAAECSNFLALPGRELLERYSFIDRIQTQETEVPEDLRQGVMCLGESTFKGHKQSGYLSNDFDYRMLSTVIIGPNRAGKSKLLANLCRDAIENGECVIIPDYIGSCQLSVEIASVFPAHQVLTIQCDDYATMQGLGYNEVPPSSNPFIQYKNAKEMTALLMTLVDSVNADDANFTARQGRFMESAALLVFLSGGSINDVFSVLMSHRKRHEYIKRLPATQKDNMEDYMDYLLELDHYDKGQLMGTKTHLITGAVDRLHRLKVNAYLEMMLKKGINKNVNLVHELQKNQLIILKMPQRMFLTDNEKDVYVTYWLTKIWLALQIREEQLGDRAKMTKVNLVIDELYQVNNAEKFLMKKLSQLPKFNMKPIISCHYLNQIKIIREELRSANASYMLISGCDKKNYEELKSELYPFEEGDLLGLPRYHSLNLIKCNGGYGKFITKLPAPISV